MSRSSLGCVYIVFLFILFVMEWGGGGGEQGTPLALGLSEGKQKLQS